MLLDIKLIGIKNETISGTIETLSSDDFIYPINNQIEIDVNIENYIRKENNGTYSNPVGISGKRSAIIKFSTYLSYTNVLIIPAWFKLFQFCGWSYNYGSSGSDWVAIIDSIDSANINETENNDIHILQIITSINVNNEIINNNTATVEIVYYDELFDKQLVYRLSGCMGTAKIIGESGKPIKVDFVFLGSLYEITTVTEIKTTGTIDETPPKALLFSDVKLHENTICVEKFEIDVGNINTLFSNIMSRSGYAGCRITDRYIIGTININDQSDVIVENYNNQISNSDGNLIFTIGQLYVICTGVKFTYVDSNKYIIDVNNKIEIGIN